MQRAFLFGIVLALGVATAGQMVQAQTRNNPLETVDQARARHTSENYQWQQRHGTPLGGYQDRLGDPAPRGTLQPGYVAPGGYGQQQPATTDWQTGSRTRR